MDAVKPAGATLSGLDYFAAATGLVVVALQIGYLPTLYGAFNRRETEVTLMAVRAGRPACSASISERSHASSATFAVRRHVWASGSRPDG